MIEVRHLTNRYVAAALVAAATAVLVTVLTTHDDNRRQGAGWDEQPPDRVRCETLPSQGKNCSTVTLDGQTFRYSLARSASTAGLTALVDIGGPGAAPLGASAPKALVEQLHDRNVLVIDEPWTTSKAPDQCDAALTAWYMTMREVWPVSEPSAIDGSLASVSNRCDVFGADKWALTAATFRRLVDKIAKTEHLRLDTYVGFSFGSVRREAVADRFPHTILVSPFAPNADASRYMGLRAGIAKPRAPETLLGVTPSNRSLPLDTLDLAAAADEAMYQEPAQRAATFTHAFSASLAGRLSDQLLGRYGADSISHSVLGYWAGTCPALTRWDDVETNAFATDPRSLVLRMCTLAPTTATAQGSTNPGQIDCVATSRDDGVVPHQLSDSLAPHAHHVTVDGPHAALAGLRACLEVPSVDHGRSFR